LKTASTTSTYNPDNYSPRPNEKATKFIHNNNLVKKPNKNVFTLKTNSKRQKAPQQQLKFGKEIKHQQHHIESDNNKFKEQSKNNTLSNCRFFKIKITTFNIFSK
jgi:hypothetical protein